MNIEYGSQGELYVSMLGNSVGSECIEHKVIANFNSKHAKDAKDRFIEHFAYVFYRLKDGGEMYFSHIFPVL